MPQTVLKADRLFRPRWHVLQSRLRRRGWWGRFCDPNSMFGLKLVLLGSFFLLGSWVSAW